MVTSLIVGRGMDEMCALVTDGRFSGSTRGPAIGHVSPEAAAGGPIAIVQDGDPILKKVCRPVTKFDDRLGTLLDDMKETLLAANGLGLAGPQVGMMRRLFICLDDRDLPKEVPENYEYKFIEFINPEILELSDEQVELYEGCLSFPGHNGAIKRSKHVKVKAQDRHGEWFEMEADDMLARCIQHENNHLDGITIMDLAEHFYEDDYPEEEED